MLDSFLEKQREVTSALGELGELASSLGAKSLSERIARDLVKKLTEDRFHLVVVGEFNHGKSSFVNALLGREALAVGVTPTTATIHHLRYAEHPEATVVYTDGTREGVAFDDVKTFAVGGGKDPARIDFIELGYPAPILKERILLVDTPGVNDLSHQRADITYSYIPRADAVLFLLDAGQILKESERVFLQEKLLKASRDKIIFVITKWDILSPEEKGEAYAYAKTQLAMLVSDPVLFAVSAELHLQGREGESGLLELVSYLTKFLSEERGRILLDNALGEGQNVALMLEKGIEAKRRSFAMNVGELDRRIQMLDDDLKGASGTIEERRAKIREETAGIKVGARKDLDRFVDEVVAKLPEVIDNAKKEELAQYLPAFLEDNFRTWAEAEAKEISEKLEALAEKTIALIKDDMQETSKRVAEVLGTDPKRLEVDVDTFHYDVGVAALFAVGFATLFFNLMLGGLLTVAAPVLAFLLKDRIDAEYKKRAKELAPKVVRQTAEKVGPKLEEMIDDFTKRLDAWVVTAGEELHREVLEVLKATKTARENGGEEEAKHASILATHGDQLVAARTRLDEMRKRLRQGSLGSDQPKGVVVSDAAPPA